jgi:hypothetical protein
MRTWVLLVPGSGLEPGGWAGGAMSARAIPVKANKMMNNPTTTHLFMVYKPSCELDRLF